MASIQFDSDDGPAPLILQNAQRLSGSVVEFENGPTDLRPIESDGVDGREYMTIGKRTTPLVYRGYIPIVGTSQELERQLFSIQSLIGTLSISEANETYQITDVVLVRVTFQPITGKLLGFGEVANANRTAVVVVEFDV